MNKNVFYADCRQFRGDIPCKPHKELDHHCIDCPVYDKTDMKVLIVKFGAIGDVIRTTPLLHKIKSEYPKAEIWWLTQYPDILPSSSIDKILTLSLENLIVLEETQFDIMFCLDKDNYACAISNKIKSKIKYGFCLKDGKPAPINKLAEDKYLTGLFDDVNKANNKSYLKEIFEIVGWEFNGEEYILDVNANNKWNIPHNGQKVIGLNTGCGDRWVSRLWKEDYWLELIELLKANSHFPILLGGKQEDEKNKRLAERSGAYYPGYFSLQEFISLINECNTIVSAVTMGMHLAIGLKKNLILLNNIFNPNEFELYGRGEIVEPREKCNCFFSPSCKNKDYFCLDHLLPEDVFNAVKRLKD
jgi:ADP-heptose:LPS heptosyltransferase